MIHKVTCIIIDALAAASLYNKVTNSSLSDAAEAEIVACVDANISTSRPDAAQASFVKPRTYFVNYLTLTDWGVIDDDKSTVHEWVHVLVTRMRRCNVKSAFEDT